MVAGCTEILFFTVRWMQSFFSTLTYITQIIVFLNENCLYWLKIFGLLYSYEPWYVLLINELAMRFFFFLIFITKRYENVFVLIEMFENQQFYCFNIDTNLTRYCGVGRKHKTR